MRCPKGHLTYFDKRPVCGKRSLVRAVRGDEIELDLPCGTEGCSEVVPVKVDCRGYL